MATLDSIQAKISKLQAQAEALASTKSTAGLTKIRDLMEKHGVTLADIEAFVGKRRGRKPGAVAATRGVVAAKYLDPKTGATWTGRGRAPAWIANVRDRSKFLVDESSAPAPAEKKSAKPGNYARGPQPALYRNPKTDETWSGRGRAPAWIASVKDRSKFLIGDAAETVVETVKGATKSTASRKVALSKPAAKKTRKVAAKKAVASKPAAKKAAAEDASVAAKAAVGTRKGVRKVVSKKVTGAKGAEASVAVEATSSAEQVPPTADAE
jgi:DNA-binding protein H-NS